MPLLLLLIAFSLITHLHSFDIVQQGLSTNIDGEPSGVIDGHVNVISGSYIDYEVDMVIPGPEPLEITRNWMQTIKHSKRSEGKRNRTEWFFGDKRGILYENADKKKYGPGNCTGTYMDTRGQQVHFFFSQPKKEKLIEADTWTEKLIHGITNTSSGSIEASSDIRNYHCSWLALGKNSWIKTPRGSTILFEKDNDFWHGFVEETLPNYLRIRRIEKKPQDIHRLENYAGEVLSQYYIESHDHLKPFWLRYIAQDGRCVEYIPVRVALEHQQTYSDQYEAVQVASVIRPNSPRVDYTYYNGCVYKDKKNNANSIIEWPKVASKSLPDQRKMEFSYYGSESVSTGDPRFCRVKEINAPLGTGPEMVVKYHFDYYLPHGEQGEGCTGVKNAKGILTNYSFDNNNRLSKIVKYNAHLTPHTDESLYWGPQNSPRQIELWGRVFGPAGNPCKTYCKFNHYDAKGNVFQEELWGNLTGRHNPHFKLNHVGLPAGGDTDVHVKNRSYSQDSYNLLLQEIEGGVVTNYGYIPNTNLANVIYRSYNGVIFERTFRDYDHNGLVILEITDDGVGSSREDLTGVTLRKIKRTVRSYTYPVGLALVETECCLNLQDGSEQLLMEKRNEHDGLGRILCQKTFGSDGLFAYEERWEYDAHGNCIFHVDPVGRRIICTYDANDNKISETGPHPDYKKKMVYDYMNRLIKVEEEHPDGLMTHSMSYDILGNLILTVDTFGNETVTEYDDFSRPIKSIAPPILSASGEWIRPVTQYQFDEMDNITCVIDPEGNETRFAHTVYKKPYKITYPDGSSESFEYDLQGRLLKEVARNGSTTLYKLDHLGRIVKKEIYSKEGVLEVQTSAVYNTFHVLSETDPQGVTTYYEYDAAGRKVSEATGDHVTFYEYDALSRPIKTIKGDIVQTVLYDPLNRQIETRIETLEGVLQKDTKYEYDVFGNRIRIEESTVDGPSITEAVYDSHNVLVLSIDPLGNRTTHKQNYHYRNEHGQGVYLLESIDALGQKSIVIHDALGRVSTEQKFNPFGTLLQQSSMFYNSAGKCTRIEQDAISKGEKLRKVVNLFEYDTFGMLRRLVQAANSVDTKEFTIHYNQLGEKDSYTKPDGVTLHYQYDGLGRLVHYFASDNSFAYRYTYNALSLPTLVEDCILNRTTIREYNIYGNMVHEQLANGLSLNMDYDQQGRITTLSLPDNSLVSYSYEGIHLKNIERMSSQNAFLYAHSYDEYDSAGRLIKATLPNQAGTAQYKYNLNHSLHSTRKPSLAQNLTYDAIGNIISSEINGEMRTFSYDPLYQLESESGPFNHSYTFDSLYNRIEKDGKAHTINCLNQLLDDGETTYTYDLSGNLIAKGGCRFSYDALDRLVRLEKENGVYNFTYDENNRCLCISDGNDEQRILFLDQSDIGTYTSDNQCLNLRVLGLGVGAEIGAAIALEIQSKVYVPIHDHNGNVLHLLDETGIVAEQYDYTAFGEESAPDHALSPWRFASKRTVAGLILFGRRLYDPKTGRWLSQDPTGYDAGPNLYAFVSNNPLTHFDAYGFFEWDTFCNSVDDGIKSAGSLIQWGAWHFALNDDFRNLAMFTGHLMEHRTYDGFKPSWIRDRCEYYKMEDKPLYNGDTILLYIPGMNNPLHEAEATRQKISESMNNSRVYMMYNADKGILRNTLDTLVDKILGVSEPSYVAAMSLRDCAKEAKDSSCKVATIAFSQGGEITYQAMKYLPVEDRAIVSNYTLGSAHFIPNMGQGDFYNIASDADPIPAIANHNYWKARNGEVEGVLFLPNTSGNYFDHAIDSPTYQEGLENIKDRIQERSKKK